VSGRMPKLLRSRCIFLVTKIKVVFFPCNRASRREGLYEVWRQRSTHCRSQK
jgi:hypothetical protein